MKILKKLAVTIIIIIFMSSSTNSLPNVNWSKSAVIFENNGFIRAYGGNQSSLKIIEDEWKPYNKKSENETSWGNLTLIIEAKKNETVYMDIFIDAEKNNPKITALDSYDRWSDIELDCIIHTGRIYDIPDGEVYKEYGGKRCRGDLSGSILNNKIILRLKNPSNEKNDRFFEFIHINFLEKKPLDKKDIKYFNYFFAIIFFSALAYIILSHKIKSGNIPNRIMVLIGLLGFFKRFNELLRHDGQQLMFDALNTFWQIESFNLFKPFTIGFKEPLFIITSFVYMSFVQLSWNNLKIFTLTLSFFALILTFVIGRKMFGAFPALVGAYLMADNRYLIFMSVQAHRIEFFSILLMLYFYILFSKKVKPNIRPYLAGMLAAAICLTRLETIFVFWIPMVYAHHIKNIHLKKDLFFALALAFILVSPLLHVSMVETGDPIHYVNRHVGWYFQSEKEFTKGESAIQNILSKGLVKTVFNGLNGLYLAFYGVLGQTFAPYSPPVFPYFLILGFLCLKKKCCFAIFIFAFTAPYVITLNIENRFRYVFPLYPLIALSLGVFMEEIYFELKKLKR